MKLGMSNAGQKQASESYSQFKHRRSLAKRSPYSTVRRSQVGILGSAVAAVIVKVKRKDRGAHLALGSILGVEARERAYAHGEKELQEEVAKVQFIVGDLVRRLQNSVEKIDLSMERIGSALKDLAEQKDKIRSLEKELGIER